MPSNLDDKEDKNGQLFIYAYLASLVHNMAFTMT